MTIYVSHSTNYDYRKELYDVIKSSGLYKEHNFIFPHDKSEEQYEVKKLFASGKCSLVIAECTYPSTGQGIELGYADIYKIPIFCIYKGGKPASRALISVATKSASYVSSEEFINALTDYFDSIG